MSYETILVDEGSVGVVTFNRPDKRNAFNQQLLQELTLAIQIFAQNSETRVIILRGVQESAFSAGADLAELAGLDAEGFRSSTRSWIELFHLIESIPLPVIASVGGWALAGGTELILACDFVVASEGAWFGLTEAHVGVIPGAGAGVRLPRWVGRAAAKEILMLGNPIRSDEAYRLGLVSRLVPDGELDSATMKLAVELTQRSAAALAAAKRAVNIGAEMDLDRGIEYVLLESAMLFGASDQREGMAAFLEKRVPKWGGSK